MASYPKTTWVPPPVIEDTTSLLDAVVQYGNIQRLIADPKAIWVPPPGIEDTTSLLDAVVQYGNIQRLIVDHPEQLDQRCRDDNDTPLLMACFYRLPDIVEMLLDAGAHIELGGVCRETPLHLAVSSNRRDIVELLLNRGANIYARTKGGASVLHFLHSGTNNDDTTVATLLLDRGADITAVAKNGSTPLHRSAKYGDLKLVSLLLTRGADMEARDNKGRTALVVACKRNRQEIAKLLMERGANCSLKFHERSRLSLEIRTLLDAPRSPTSLLELVARFINRNRQHYDDDPGKLPLPQELSVRIRRVVPHDADRCGSGPIIVLNSDEESSDYDDCPYGEKSDDDTTEFALWPGLQMTNTSVPLFPRQ